MAPARPRDPSFDHSPEYDEFLNKLEQYHAQRGYVSAFAALRHLGQPLISCRSTTLERDPKIGQRHINLLRLYERVCEEGGYDRVSDTKNNKLAWRRIAAEFLPSHANATTQAFLVKTIYYKNLAYALASFTAPAPARLTNGTEPMR